MGWPGSAERGRRVAGALHQWREILRRPNLVTVLLVAAVVLPGMMSHPTSV